MGIFSDTLPTSPAKSTFAGFPTDIDSWSCTQWEAYYNRNKKIFGVEKAKEIINIDMGNIGFFADVQNCKYDCSFVNFFEKEGFEDIGNIFSKTYCTASKAVDTAGDVVDTVSSTVTNLGDTITTLTKPKLLIAVVIVGAIVYFEMTSKKSFKRKR